MIYLDNSATTQPYPAVLDSFMKVSTGFWGNPSSLHGFGGKAEQLLAKAREQAAGFLKVNPAEIIFTSGGSESNNLAIKGAALQYKARGKHIITSSIEHPSVLNPAEQLSDLGYEITYLPVDEYGRVNVTQLKEAIREDTILVSIMHINNEIGSIQPIEEIGQLLRHYPKILFHVDGVQGFSKVDLSLTASHVDLYSLSGHKIHGLKGTGLLYKREGVKLSPLIAGGNQESGFRSGTESVAGAVSLAKAMRLVIEESKSSLGKMKELQEYAMSRLAEIDGLVINTPYEKAAPHIINFSIPGLKSEAFVHTLEDEEIYVSTTSACSSKKKSMSHTLLQMGKGEKIAGSSIRISLHFGLEKTDIDKAVAAVGRAIQMLSEVNKR